MSAEPIRLLITCAFAGWLAAFMVSAVVVVFILIRNR